MEAWLVAILGGAAAILLARWLVIHLTKKRQPAPAGEQPNVEIGDQNTGVAIGKNIRQNIAQSRSENPAQAKKTK